MSNEAVRDEWQNRFGRSDPKVICVGLNYKDHQDESGMELPEGAAALLEVRERASAATATRSCCRTASATSTRRPSWPS